MCFVKGVSCNISWGKLKPGLALKNLPNKTPKNPPKKTIKPDLKWVFLVF